MKKFLFISIVLFGFQIQAQETSDQKSNELKINMTNLIGFKWVDLSYENLLNEESSIGVGLLFSLDSEMGGIDEYRTFSLTPYYRHYFSSKYAQGFFVETFGMLHTGKNDFYYDDYNNDRANEKYTDFAAGVSVGAKFLTKRGFVAEIYAGIGRDLLGNSDIEVVGRGGIAIGKRF